MKCLSKPFTVGKLLVERNVIDENPVYQRESGLWSEEKQQLFIDSLFNDFDVPKIYFHDIRGQHPTKHYAVVDGKQRLFAIWSFLASQTATAADFRIADDLGHPPAPQGAVRFKELPAYWQEAFKSKSLDVVLIEHADDDDIEELFSRLNNGEPLNAAEKRNAIGGAMCELVREVAKLDSFTKSLSVPNRRYQHLEIAAKLLLIEKTESTGGGSFADLKKRFLDTLVRDNKEASAETCAALKRRVSANLRKFNRVFEKHDPLLNKQAYPPLYYLWVKLMIKDYAHPQLYSRLRSFLSTFHTRRNLNLQRPEDQREPALIEFGRLMQQGTNDIGSLQERVAILRRYFLQEYPDTELRDRVRSFSPEERWVIWVLGGKTCAECGRALAELEDMEADHVTQWAHGGSTKISNGRSLCKQCNARLSKKVA